jgi:hypothetical protein
VLCILPAMGYLSGMPDHQAPLGHVDAKYRHYPKHVTPKSGMDLPGVRFKWYDIHRSEAPVPEEIQRLARDFLRAESQAGRLEVDNDLGFVLLHRCGEDFYFLLVSTWRNANELWECVYYKNGAAMPGFDLFKFDGKTRKGTYCVWELGAVWHEQQAWVRFLMSPRDDQARRAYLEDRFSGQV